VILLTTSRRPTGRTRTFCNDLERSVPNLTRINRGKLGLDGIAEKALELDADRVAIVNQWKGGLGKIGLFEAGASGLVPSPPLIYIRSMRLRREFGAKIKPVRSLVISTTPRDSSEIERLAEAFSKFFRIPRSSDGDVFTYEAVMRISMDASHRTQITFVLLPQAIEVGPRITVSHAVWGLR